MEWLLAFVSKEWRVIKKAPFHFFGAVILVGFAVWWVMEWRYSDRLETANQTIKLIETRVEVGRSGDVVGKIDALTKELESLRQETSVGADFSLLKTTATEGGGYVVRVGLRIQAVTPRSGLTIGISADNFNRVGQEITTTDITTISEYQGKPYLGLKRYHFRPASGSYTFDVHMDTPGALTIRHEFEGRKEGAVVSWQIPKS